ncbi:MAG: hypothetical protein ACYC27_09905 [Armatimonadota bacterium]
MGTGFGEVADMNLPEFMQSIYLMARVGEWMLHPVQMYGSSFLLAAQILLELSINLLIILIILIAARKIAVIPAYRIALSLIFATAGLVASDYMGDKAVGIKIATSGYPLDIGRVYSLSASISFAIVYALISWLILRLNWKQSIITGVVIGICLIPAAYKIERLHITAYSFYVNLSGLSNNLYETLRHPVYLIYAAGIIWVLDFGLLRIFRHRRNVKTVMAYTAASIAVLIILLITTSHWITRYSGLAYDCASNLTKIRAQVHTSSHKSLDDMPLDKQTLHCPADRDLSSKISYEYQVSASDGTYMIICRHHPIYYVYTDSRPGFIRMSPK